MRERRRRDCRQRRRLYDACIEALEARRLLAANLVISEFLASNDHSIPDAAGDHEDWIEIHNCGDADANLNDYFLTDSAGNPELWRFPSQTLAAGGFLVVFASGRDIAVAGQEMHTNFKLSASGEYLGLIRAADDSVQFEYAPTFPVQSTDVSYGLFNSNDPSSALTYFNVPSPGAPNTPSASTPVFSQPGKMFSGSIQIALSSTTPGAQIRYTTDRTIPTASSPLYGAPLALTTTTIIRAMTFASGYLSSAVVSESYVAVDSTVSGFSSNLPIMVLDTFGTTINDTTLIPAAASIIDTTDGNARADMLDTPNFDGRIGLRIRGSTSENYPKKGFAVEVWDENNGDKKASLLGMPANSDWVLMDPYSEKSLMQNDLAMKWANETGHYASRTRFVEVYLNTDGGTSINYNSDYWGVYILMEKIKADNNRVNITKMSTSDNTGDAVTGGYIFKKDRIEPTEKSFTTTLEAQKYAMVEPDETSITTQQLSYISGYMNDLETALYGSNFADPVNGYAKYIDVDSFVDYWLANEMTRNVDAFWLSTFFSKDRLGKVALGPSWDFNLSLGNANYRDGADSAGWNHDTLTTNEYGYFPRLFQDPNFTQKVIDRWEQLRKTVFSTTQMMADIDADVAKLSDNNGNYPVGTSPTQVSNNAVVRNFKKWQVLGTFVSSNSFYDPQGRWIEDVKLMKNWLTARLTWMDSLYIPVPTLSPGGGSFGSPTSVTMTPHAQATGSDTTILDSTIAPLSASYIVPTANISNWQSLTFTPTGSWTTMSSSQRFGIGYDTQTSPVNFLPFINTNVQSQLLNHNSSIFTRFTFNIANPAAIGSLILKVQYDDGFIAWVNGVRVMDANSPENINPVYNTAAASNGDDNLAITYREFDISSVKNELVAGTNVLAIQGLNSSSSNVDFLLTPVLVSRQYTSATTGAIYYTLDGSDPRASDGSVSSAALLYGGSVALSSSTRIRARTLIGGAWSGLADEVYTFGADPLRITEMMYNPSAPPPGGTFTAQDFEFIEFKNTGTSPLNLAGYSLTDGVTFSFPNATLAPGSYAVAVKNVAAFTSRYGTLPNVFGPYSGNLDNGSENVAFKNGFAQTVQSFTYHDSWYPQTDGGGYSLVIRDPLGDVANWALASGWRASYALQGLPTADDADNTAPTVQSAVYDPVANTVKLTFSETVTTTSPSGATLTETLSGNPVNPGEPATSGSIATFTVPALADGVYRLTLPAVSIADLAGNHPAGNAVFRFILVAGGHTLALPAGGPAYITDQLIVGSGAALDLADNDLVVNNGSVSSIRSMVFNGFGGTTGIRSSTSDGSQILALFDNALIGTHTWDGQPISATAIVGKYTYFGDMNLDGQVTADDYGILDANFGATPPLGIAWLSGDANLDGSVTGDDYGILDANFGNGVGAPFSPYSSVAIHADAGQGALTLSHAREQIS